MDRKQIAKEISQIDDSFSVFVKERYFKLADYVLAREEQAKKDAVIEIVKDVKIIYDYVKENEIANAIVKCQGVLFSFIKKAQESEV